MNHSKALLIAIFTLIVTVLSSDCVGQTSDQERWTYSVGMGMATAPSYLGDDEYQLLLFPFFSARYGDKFFASFFEGVGYNLLHTNTWRVGPILKTNIGRFEDGTVPASITGKTNDLTGLGDVGFTVEPGAFIEYTKASITTKFELRKGIGGHKGLIGNISTYYRSTFKLNEKVIYYAIGPDMRITGSNFNNAFFGINPEQSSKTELELYDAGSGVLWYGLSGSLIVPIDQKLSATALIRYSKLGKVASDAHLIRKSGSAHQSTIGFMVNYKLR